METTTCLKNKWLCKQLVPFLTKQYFKSSFLQRLTIHKSLYGFNSQGVLSFGKVWTTLKTPLIGIKGNTDSLAKTWDSESSVVKHKIKGAYCLLVIGKQLWKWVCFTSILDWCTESVTVVETTQQFKTSLHYLIKTQEPPSFPRKWSQLVQAEA